MKEPLTEKYPDTTLECTYDDDDEEPTIHEKRTEPNELIDVALKRFVERRRYLTERLADLKSELDSVEYELKSLPEISEDKIKMLLQFMYER